MSLSADSKVTLAMLLLGGVGVFLAYRAIRSAVANPGATGQAIGEGVAGVVTGVASGVVGAGTGVVLGAGDALGVPRTDQTQCEKDLAAGDKWAASFSCPAGTFLKNLFN